MFNNFACLYLYPKAHGHIQQFKSYFHVNDIPGICPLLRSVKQYELPYEKAIPVNG